LVKSWGHPVEERNISIDEVVRAHQSGELEEMFGSGTAAVISPVGVLSYKGRSYEIGEGKTGALAQRLFEELTAIQYGKRADPFNWIRQVDVHQNIANTPTVNTVAV
ncbi:MAG: hypothetical protein O6934_05125, partial [SAR324 cluster bacterium]|nr:hypothetical protein [SAR324 cluster bacterium]